MSSASSSYRSVIVSNGTEFFEISVDDLETAQADGFYLPQERGMTVVSNGNEIFEVLLEDAPAAIAEGFRDLVADLKAKQKASASKRESAEKRQKTSSNNRSFAGLPIGPTVDRKLEINTGNDESSFELDPAALQTGDNGASPVAEAVTIVTGADQSETIVNTTSPIVLEDVVDEDAERRLEIEEQLEDAKGVEKIKLWLQLYSPTTQQFRKFSRSYGVSVLLHIAVLVILSLVLLHVDDPQNGGAVFSSIVAAEDAIEEDAEDVAHEVEMEDTELTDSAVAEAADLAGELNDTLGLQTNNLLSSFDASAIGGGAEGLSEALGQGLEKSSGKSAKTGASFFGSKTTASRFVFVIDNSMSMTKGRFETALNELAKTITRLTPQQSFYIVFYSDTAYGMFYPRTYNDAIPATPRNKTLAIQWLTTVELCFLTNASKALQMAYTLRPDVIFMLGDGAFSDNKQVVSFMNGLSPAAKKVTVHTLGMEVNRDAAEKLKFLSKASGGKYNDVGVHPQAAIMAKQSPRKTNRKRGPIWGITLGQ